MKLEELAGALTELKEQLLIYMKEESAGANEMLLTELRKRIMAGQRELIKRKESIKPAKKKLNMQQSKFLKQAPIVENPEGIS